MSRLTLSARLNLEQLKKQAKELLGKIRERDPQAVAPFARHHPNQNSREGVLRCMTRSLCSRESMASPPGRD